MKTRATTKGQVTIPCLLRRKFGIKAGTRIEFAVDEKTHQIILTPITRHYVQRVRGRYRGKRLLEQLAAEKKVERCL